MRAVFFGTSEFGVPSLERLVAHHHVACCVTQPDRPQGRGLMEHPSAIRIAAQRLDVPIEAPSRLREAAAQLRTVPCDVGILASYGQMVPAELLSWPQHGILGIHPSLLPKYRGAAPIVWPILKGDPQTGVTIYRLVQRLDAGEILLQRATSIGPRETNIELHDRLARWSGELLLEALSSLEQGTATWRPQDETQATYAPKLTKSQGVIDWTSGAETIDRMIRALAPWPGACTTWHGELLKIWTAIPEAAAKAARPGEVLSASGDGVVIAANDGALRVQELQPACGRCMAAKEFLAGHHLQAGDRLG